MYWILQLLVNAGVLFLMAGIISDVKVRSYGTAIIVALVIGFLNATIGFLIRLPLNIITLGLLSFLVRLLVTALVIKITDKFFSGFEVKTFLAALLLAIALAIGGTLLDYVFY
jgi:putative membrane protein